MLERTQNTCNIITIHPPGRYFQPPHPLSPSTMLHPTIISIFWGRKPWQIHLEEKHVFLLYKHLSDILRGKLIPCQNCNFFCCSIFLHPSLLSIIIEQWRCDIFDRSSLKNISLWNLLDNTCDLSHILHIFVCADALLIVYLHLVSLEHIWLFSGRSEQQQQYQVLLQ